MSVKPNKTLAIWLLIICFFIIVLVIFGGYVRLTRSGLSMVEWKVITGMMPPIGEKTLKSYKRSSPMSIS